MPTRWVGIDEAGYGPNLGPLVMSAVVAESPDGRPPALWHDLADNLDRAGGRSDRLWVDDSKALYRGGLGRDRLEAACLAVTASASGGHAPETLGGLLKALGSGTLDDAELSPWLDAGDPPVPTESARARVGRALAIRPFEGASWRVVSVRAVVVGPARFNARLAAHRSKAGVHFEVFARLLGDVWRRSADESTTYVHGDKHGGRHYYYDPLVGAFPEARIGRGVEGPTLSHYTLDDAGRRLELRLTPRADAHDGLSALASVVSKAVREYWMDAFNAHWVARVPALRPTAGYPGDAPRFRQAIEPLCEARGLTAASWWRSR